MKGGAYVIINRQANDGITKIGTLTGGIINKDENENNYVSWMIKNGAINDYAVPWLSSGLTAIPFTYHVSTIGSNDGSVQFSTWQTQSNNSTPVAGGISGKPTGVTNINNPSGSDNSLYCADRFWWVKFANYTLKPVASLTFSYVDPTEFAAPNTINETDLQAQYWSANQWVYPPTGSDIAASNYVNGVAAQIFDAPWVLVSKLSPLPIELLSFNAFCIGGNKVKINWSTASETNNDYFVIERSNDSQLWETVMNVNGAGNSNTTLCYNVEDNQPYQNSSYYRLKQVNYNGTFTYSDMVSTDCKTDGSFNLISIMSGQQADNNIVLLFTASEDEPFTYALYDVRGRLLQNKSEKAVAGTNEVSINTNNLCTGIYFITLQNSEKFFGKKILLNNFSGKQ